MLDTHADSVVMPYSYFLSWKKKGKWANKSSYSNIRIFQASAAVQLCPLFFWDVTQHRLMVGCWCCATFQDGTNRLSKSLVTNLQQVQCNIPEEWQLENLITWSKISKAKSFSCCKRFTLKKYSLSRSYNLMEKDGPWGWFMRWD